MHSPITIDFAMIEAGTSLRSDGSAVPALRITGQDGQIVTVLMGPRDLQRLADAINGLMDDKNSPTVQ